jgi:N-methylhydantoinase A
MFYSCIDIGGTFTDLVVHSDERGLEIFKSPTTPGEFELGFMNALGLAAESHALPLADFLARNDFIVHGTTVSTNALVEGKTAPVGLICNAGHPDVLTIREAPRKRAFTVHIHYPQPFVPRSRTREVRGRIEAMGGIFEPLNEQDVVDAVAHFKRCEVGAVAVSLLWSIVNPMHELRVREIVEREWPGVPVTLSHEVNPIPREYRRTIASAIDASLHPIVTSYTARLVDVLHKAGYEKDLLIANCVGGMMPPDEIIRRPIYSVMSGPTLAPVAALNLTEAANVIIADMGGTTFDVSAVRDRQIVVTPEATFGMDLLGIPKIDVRSVGAGGGSIASVDAGGLLKVGPKSAGANPGPACYGRGGTLPTVTDANLVLGIIDPDNFLGGRMKVDKAKAEAAIAPLAEMLGLDILSTAWSIYTTVNHNMIAAIEDITVNEGIDPRESYLVSGGGATACHIGDMARIIGIRQFMVPKLTAGLSAFGGLLSDLRWEETSTLHMTSRNFDARAIDDLLEKLKRRGNGFLERAGVLPEARSFTCAFQARYLYQSWDIEVAFDRGSDGLKASDLNRLAAAFHAQHERIYTIKDEDDVVEFTTWKVRAIGDTGGRSRLGRPIPDHEGAIVARSHRPVFVDRKLQTMPVYDGSRLGAGACVHGPAVIEEDTTTFLLLAGQTAMTDQYGNYLVESDSHTPKEIDVDHPIPAISTW